MAVSVFDLFKIGIGPSSSHTVGPMKAACSFARRLERVGLLERTAGVRVNLYGSLAHAGRGHGTDKAVMLGLQGELPDRVDPDRIEPMLEVIRGKAEIRLLGRHPVPFDEELAGLAGSRLYPGSWSEWCADPSRPVATGPK